jgi:hypothetical protein
VLTIPKSFILSYLNPSFYGQPSFANAIDMTLILGMVWFPLYFVAGIMVGLFVRQYLSVLKVKILIFILAIALLKIIIP